MNVWAYWFSDKMVLKMYKAREVDAASSPYSVQHGRRARPPRRAADATGIHHR